MLLLSPLPPPPPLSLASPILDDDISAWSLDDADADAAADAAADDDAATDDDDAAATDDDDDATLERYRSPPRHGGQLTSSLRSGLDR